MNRIQWSPLDELSTLQESIDVLLEAPRRWRGRAVAMGQPPVDIFETEHEFIIRAELPSIDPKDVEINVTDHTLIIKGEFKRKSEDSPGVSLRRELRYGTFLRTLVLPCDVKSDQAKAFYENGILEIHVSKKRPLKSDAASSAA